MHENFIRWSFGDIDQYNVNDDFSPGTLSFMNVCISRRGALRLLFIYISYRLPKLYHLIIMMSAPPLFYFLRETDGEAQC